MPEPTPADLTSEQLGILEFARLRWAHAGAKETAILERFGMSLTRYCQVLNDLLDSPAALEHDPALVRRLRRLRAARRDQRSARARAIG
ncbi:DUF3263 domain-containing protein [Nocardioides bruguierae]|uniref:DUF3263 domain-containing protein n=1 Tax=Nocardioides bruguierae TaxID=2945102 RepID=A0A9X2DDA3_9ACTN|nr:DUF3263 domain-containing protein [Nocardioides bruguierae]MCM0622349.1 DUF3263 domain-containing protein [Nocardioides bruguierae]